MRFKAIIKRLRSLFLASKSPNIKRFLQDEIIYSTIHVIIKDFYTFRVQNLTKSNEPDPDLNI